MPSKTRWKTAKSVENEVENAKLIKLKQQVKRMETEIKKFKANLSAKKPNKQQSTEFKKLRAELSKPHNAESTSHL